LGLAGFIYIKQSPSIYKVDAILDKTSDYQLQRIQPSMLEKGVAYQVKLIDLDVVYSTALAHADSLYVKRLFWEGHTGAKVGLFGSTESEQSENYKNFIDDLSVQIPNLKTPSRQLSTASFESETPVEAENLLRDYLKFIDQHTMRDLIAQLRTAYMAVSSRLESDYQSLLEREKQKIADDLIRLSEAYEIAKALNIIDTPYEQVENVELGILDDKQYLLGARVLGEEINSLKARLDKPLAAFVPMLRDMEHWKGQLERDLARLDGASDTVHAFVVVSPPESSIDPVKPNKLLIFIAVLFAAGILGVVIVFTREGIKSYKARGIEQEI